MALTLTSSGCSRTLTSMSSIYLTRTTLPEYWVSGAFGFSPLVLSADRCRFPPSLSCITPHCFHRLFHRQALSDGRLATPPYPQRNAAIRSSRHTLPSLHLRQLAKQSAENVLEATFARRWCRWRDQAPKPSRSDSGGARSKRRDCTENV